MHIVAVLKAMVTWLGTYWLDAVIVLAAVAVALYLWRNGKKDVVKRMILTFVIQAEKEYGSGTGRIKFEAVLSNVYQSLPLVLRLLINKDQIVAWIEDAVQWMKRELADGNKNLLSLSAEALLKGDPVATMGKSSGPVA